MLTFKKISLKLSVCYIEVLLSQKAFFSPHLMHVLANTITLYSSNPLYRTEFFPSSPRTAAVTTSRSALPPVFLERWANALHNSAPFSSSYQLLTFVCNVTETIATLWVKHIFIQFLLLLLQNAVYEY